MIHSKMTTFANLRRQLIAEYPVSLLAMYSAHAGDGLISVFPFSVPRLSVTARSLEHRTYLRHRGRLAMGGLALVKGATRLIHFCIAILALQLTPARRPGK